jgi:hypothetical protein
MEQNTPTGLVSNEVRFLGTARPSGALCVMLLTTLPFENIPFRYASFLTTRSPWVSLLCSKHTLGPTQKTKPGIAENPSFFNAARVLKPFSISIFYGRRKTSIKELAYGKHFKPGKAGKPVGRVSECPGGV